MGRGQELLDAAREGDRKIVEKIIGQITKRSGPFTSLRRGAGVNVQDDNGYTPLHHACLRGHKEIVRLLLSVDASPGVVDKKGATPLHLAAWKGDADVVSILLSHSNPPVNIDQLTSDQETALLIAAQFGNVDVVAALLARGADVTARNVKDESALDLAAQYGRLETVQHLLRARPQLVDPYRFPVSRGRLFSTTPLHRASKNGHKEVVSTLISAGVDANVRTHAGTALHEAANYGKASVVRILLGKGADLNAADRRGKTVHDILNEYSLEATKRVRRIIREHMATNGYDSEEDLPPFPVTDYSPTGYANTGLMKTPETQKNFSLSLSSSSSSIPNKSHHQGFVQKLAKKYLGFKAKFNSAPNISNPSSIEPEISVRSKNQNTRDNTKSIQIGNSKFFKLLSKKEDAGEIVCNDEFDTISLDRLGSLDRSTAVNRSNRSCPGFKTSLPHIAEHTELTDSEGSLSDSVVICEEVNENNKRANTHVNETVNINPKLSIFEPRKEGENTRISNTSSESANIVNECYESYEFVKSNIGNMEKVDLIPKPSPRPTIEARKNSTEGIIYENVALENKHVPPKPAERTTVSPKLIENETKVVYESMTPRLDVRRPAPEPPKRTVVPDSNTKNDAKDPGSSSDLSSNFSSDSMSDEADFEDILLSKKSTSFKHRTKITVHKNSVKSDLNKSQSLNSLSSGATEASAMENVDCSAELDEKSMYLSMTGTLPSKKPERAVKKKVLFRHKTFTNIEVDRNSINNFPKSKATETLANYHIRGTGHCIYKAPTVEEFIYVFNRNTLYKDVAPFDKVEAKRDSYFETAICFCKPVQPKFHKSAEDLLEVAATNEDIVSIDLDALTNYKEMSSTSFKCFCDTGSCTFHADKRGSENNLVVRFSAIKKSISSPNITLECSPLPTPKKPNLTKNRSVPSILEEPYAVVDILKISANNDKENRTPQSNQSTASREYSLKDIADEISVNSGSTLKSVASSYLRQSSSSSGHWSLHTCNSNATVKSEESYKTCIEEDSSDDGTLHSDDAVSDSDTIKTDTSAKKPWVHSDSFRFDSKDSTETSGVESASPLDASLESGPRGLVRSGSGRRRWDEPEGTSEGDALSLSSAASSCAPHLAHHQEYNKISPTPPKKPPRRNLSVSPTHANSPSSGYSYELRTHARSQDDLDDLQGSKHYLKHGRSVDQYVDGKLSYSEYDESPRLPNPPVPKPRPSLQNRTQPVAITAMYENVVIKQQNPKRKLRRTLTPQSENEPGRQKSLESLLDSSMSASDCERFYEGAVIVPLSPTHYEQPPTPEHPPPSARQAENSIHERIRPLSQEYKRWSAHALPRASSAASVASAATDRSGDAVVEYVGDVPFAGLFKGSTTTLDGLGLRPAPAERPKTLRKLRAAYDPPAEPAHNGDDERRRSNSASQERSLSILSPFDEQEEWAKISEIMASFGSKLGRESLFVSEFEQEFSRLGLSCSESSLSSAAGGLASFGADHEAVLQDHGYDDVDFVNGVLDEADLRQMGIDESDRQRILQTSKQLPKKITDISNNIHNNSKQPQTVDQWLKSIHLEQYSDAFRKHLYSDMERVKRIWEVELTAVLEIHKIGHRKRILASVVNAQSSPVHVEDINADLNCLKNNIKQLKDEIKEKLPISENLKPVAPPTVPSLAPPGGETLKRSKKNRPAPQPPKPSDLEIRAPSELLVGFPGALKTQWKHQPFVLVTGAVTYVANYLGSTVVKELRGTESTKKSIQKLKKSAKEPRDSPDIILSITYRGVKFLNTITRELICEHEIRNIHCACQDADDLTHFAYITKDHGTRSHYCHVFCVATMDQATEVILTLGEAFEVAYQMALRDQSNRRAQTKTPTHDPTSKERLNHGRSHSITEIKLNGHQLKIAPMPTSLSNENFQEKDGSKSPRGLLKAPIASTEEL